MSSADAVKHSTQVGLTCDTWHHAIEWESKLDG